MAVWLCRAGRFGERENEALDEGLAIIGWEELPSLATISSREELAELMLNTYPEAGEGTLQNWRNQLWAFSKGMQQDDVVVLPLKQRPAIAFGYVAGEYRFDPLGAAKHSRPVRWIVKDVPRTGVPKDLLFSLGASQTVCKITRHNAEQRIAALLRGENPSVWIPSSGETNGSSFVSPTEAEEPMEFDLQERADDQIRQFLQARFSGHDLARLVEGIMSAKGFKTLNSKPGRDGGVDILAGRGELGFETPKICIQVKSEDRPLDVSVLRELQATVGNFGAEHGLLVGWGGFKQSLWDESKRHFFKIRLWDSSDLLNNLFSVYDKLSPELQAEIQLKRIWTLVPSGIDRE